MEKLKYGKVVTFKVVHGIGNCLNHLGEVFSVPKSTLGNFGCGVKQELKYPCCHLCLGYIQLPWKFVDHGPGYKGSCVGAVSPGVWCLEIVNGKAGT